MIYMLDTNICIYALNRAEGSDRILRRMSARVYGEIVLSAVTIAELRYGMANSAFPKDNMQRLNEFLEIVHPLDFPVEATGQFAAIRHSLKTKGKAIGPYDLLIAAHARHLEAVLVTNDVREFSAVTGLKLQNWLSD
jgi:tRNA(fMet)-specific endonuclease VapC